MPSPNDDRSRVKDPKQPEFKDNLDNRSKQLGQRPPNQGAPAPQGGQAGVRPLQKTGGGKK